MMLSATGNQTAVATSPGSPADVGPDGSASADELAGLEAEYRVTREAIREWEESAWSVGQTLHIAEARRLLQARDQLLARQRQLRIRLANLGRNDIWETIDGRAGFITPRT